ncbi:MAG: hypothetical protein LBR15_03875 [Methanobrevibacter sp.]|jgi:hypothetical protein|nr:hypothetical protein [Candidatus Methanovirga australis]
MFKKIAILSTLFLICLGMVGQISAATFEVDADWRLVHNFKLIDINTGELLFDTDVAAGHSTKRTFDSGPHKLHAMQLNIDIMSKTCKPNYHSFTNFVYDGGDIKSYCSLDYSVRGWCYYSHGWVRIGDNFGRSW